MTQFVKSADGVTLAVVEWGNPDGPEVVLIHGAGQSRLCFAKQRDSDLARDFRLVASICAGMAGRTSRVQHPPTRTAACGLTTSPPCWMQSA